MAWGLGRSSRRGDCQGGRTTGEAARCRAGRALEITKGKMCLIVPSNAIPGQPSAPGGAELGSKPSTASQIKTTLPCGVWRDWRPRLLSSKWECGVGKEAGKDTRSWLRWGWLGRAVPEIWGGLFGILGGSLTWESRPCSFTGCGRAESMPQETECEFSFPLAS